MVSHLTVEIVTYDPDDQNTYPSVCADPEEVRARFGFTGGEKLVFTDLGLYLGRLTDQLEDFREIKRLRHVPA